MPVGILDSGLGGLTIRQAVARRLPELSLAYLGDNSNAPYGTRSQEQIFALTSHAVRILWDQGCDLVILACNTASAAALRRLQEGELPSGKRVLGVFVPMIEALIGRDWGDNSPPRLASIERVALFATPATVASRAFQRELAFRAIGVDVEAQPCGGLVDAIEAGDIELARTLASAHADALLRRMAEPQAAVLACTHYPFVSDAFTAALGKKVPCLDQAKLVAESLADYLVRHDGMAGESGDHRYLTTGEPDAVSRRATQLLGQMVSFEGVQPL